MPTVIHCATQKQNVPEIVPYGERHYWYLCEASVNSQQCRVLYKKVCGNIDSALIATLCYSRD